MDFSNIPQWDPYTGKAQRPPVRINAVHDPCGLHIHAVSVVGERHQRSLFKLSETAVQFLKSFLRKLFFGCFYNLLLGQGLTEAL